jgi:hypothetical protein
MGGKMQIEANKRYRLTGEIVADVDSWLDFRGELERLLWDQQLMPTDPGVCVVSVCKGIKNPEEFRLKYLTWWADKGAHLYAVTKNEGFTIVEISKIDEGITQMNEIGRHLMGEFNFFASNRGLQPNAARELFRQLADALQSKMESRKETEQQWNLFRLSVVRCSLESGPVLTDDEAWGQWAETIHEIEEEFQTGPK